MATFPLSAKAVFDEAVEIASPDERRDYLERACADAPVLRQKVEALLSAYADASSFLESPPAPPGDSMDLRPAAERPGTMIGRYKLLKQIGEGGMGVVWMAEQTQPVQRKVALKVIKPGMDSRQVVARFEAERQALAVMDHVNIARVLDGGATEAGLPYFVMELVHGVPITKYCDDNHLTPRERLELFVPVCQAIQHAHQKGIIHRDIKPSNVMVTLYDGKPVPKVIDFGVAKATEHKLSDRTLFTQYGMLVGTLEYMSPEQAETSAQGVDTRSDIFSLGVLLYELLTGSTPLTHERMKEAAHAELLRMIKEEEPPKPSTRLSDSGEALASISANRHTEPAKLAKLMRGDLDWILLKCLEKDRTRRYETANGLAVDILRHLHDEPVTAGAPSAGYRFRKFVKRNRAQVIAAGIVAGALVLGVVGTTSGMIWALNEKDRAIAEKTKATLAAESEAAAKVQAQENEKKAIAEAKRAKTIRLFVMTALRAGDAAMSGHAGGTEGAGQDMTILAAMDNAIKDIDSGRFKDDQETEAGLRVTIGTILMNNGRLLEAEPLMREALGTLRRVLGDEHRNTLASIGNLGQLLQAQGRLAEAEPYVREALETSRRVLGNEDPDTLAAINNMGILLQGQGLHAQGKLAEAEPYLREALDQRRRVLSDEHPNTLSAISNMGSLLKAQGKLTEAEPYFREALDLSRRVLGEHPDTLISINKMGSLLHAQGKRAEAEPYWREALEMSRRLYKGDHPFVAMSLNRVAGERLELGRAAEAEPLFVEELEMNQRLFKGDHPNVAKALGNLARARQDLGRAAEAEPLLVQAVEMQRRIYRGDDPDLAIGLNNLADLRLELGRAADAEPLFVESLEMRQRIHTGDHPEVAIALHNLALLRRGLGKTAEARQGLDQAVAMLRRCSPDGSPPLACFLWSSGTVRFDDNGGRDAAAALPELEEAVTMAEKFLPPEHPHLEAYRTTLAECRAALAEQGKPDAKEGGR